eukprot:96730_1
MASTELSGSRGSAAASGEPLKKSKRLWWSLCLASRPAKRHLVPCELSRVDKLSSSRIYLPDNLRPRDVREFCRNALSEVFERFKNNIPLLDPIKDMKISDKQFKRFVRNIDSGSEEEELKNYELHQSETLELSATMAVANLGHCRFIENNSNSNELEPDCDYNSSLKPT